MTTVSVIIPAFHAGYLESALESLFSQSRQPDEVILVDSSPETTTPRLQPWRHRVEYHFQPPRGVSAARNFGIRKACGKYIALLDADDIWLAGKLDKQIALLEQHPDAGFAFSTVWNLVDTETTAIPREPFYPAPLRKWIGANEPLDGAVKGGAYDLLLEVNCVATSSLVIRREAFNVVGCFDESFRNAEDYEFELRLAKRYPTIFINEPTSRYRVHDTGLSGAWLARGELFYRTNLAALEKHDSLFPSRAVKRAIATTCSSYASHCLRAGQPKLAASLACRSWRLSPTLAALKCCAEAMSPATYGWFAALRAKCRQSRRAL